MQFALAMLLLLYNKAHLPWAAAGSLIESTDDPAALCLQFYAAIPAFSTPSTTAARGEDMQRARQCRRMRNVHGQGMTLADADAGRKKKMACKCRRKNGKATQPFHPRSDCTSGCVNS